MGMCVGGDRWVCVWGVDGYVCGGGRWVCVWGVDG